jgi:hypothetical protein
MQKYFWIPAFAGMTPKGVLINYFNMLQELLADKIQLPLPRKGGEGQSR